MELMWQLGYWGKGVYAPMALRYPLVADLLRIKRGPVHPLINARERVMHNVITSTLPNKFSITINFSYKHIGRGMWYYILLKKSKSFHIEKNVYPYNRINWLSHGLHRINF